MVVLGTWCTGSEQGCINRYLVVLCQFWILLVVVRTLRYWFSRGRHRVLCLYIMEETGFGRMSLIYHRLTTLKDNATQLLRSRSGALVTQPDFSLTSS